MSNVVTCYKWVYDDSDIRIAPDLSVDTKRAQKKISEYDNNALEAGKRAAAALGGQHIGLTCGPKDTKKGLKPALSRGLDKTIWINTGSDAPASGETAKLLAAAIAKTEDVGLVICSDGSGDLFARQTAPRVAAILGWPVVTGVNKIEADGNALVLTRKLESELEVLRVETPVVVAVLSEINDAPLPGLQDVIKAGKKPVDEIPAADLVVQPVSGIEVESELGSVMERKNVVFKDGDMQEKVGALVAELKKEGVL